MIILKDYENRRVYKEDEMAAFLDRIEESTVRTRYMIKEGNILPLDNVPILMDQMRDLFKIPSEVSDESVRDIMESTGIILKAPTGENGNLMAYPIAESATASLFARAGFFQASCLRYGSNNSRTQMCPTDRADVLNAGMKCFGSSAISVIRDEKIRAVLSGDEGDYSVIPANTVYKTVMKTLRNISKGEVKFHYGDVNHEYTSFSLVIEDNTLLSSIKSAFSRGVNKWDETYRPVIKVCTSDIGFSGANIYPMLVNQFGQEIPLGTSLKTPHKGKRSIMDVEQAAGKIFSCFRESTENIEKLSRYSVKDLAGLVKCAAKMAKLPKGLTFRMLEKFRYDYGENVYGVDVYFLLMDILDSWYQEGKINAYMQLMIGETIARLLFENRISEIDFPFEWE